MQYEISFFLLKYTLRFLGFLYLIKFDLNVKHRSYFF